MAPEILFRDRRFLIINKPSGLPVHPGRTSEPSVEDFFLGWRRGKAGPWLAHRLDQDTAGCLVVALKKSSLLAAQDLFAKGEVQKTYWALVRGAPNGTEGQIDIPLAKVTTGKSWKMVAADSGVTASTAWRLLGQAGEMAWLELLPKTGRTHQIRAHCAAIGYPIVGDKVYGGGGTRLCLLARAIALPLDPLVIAQAPVPEHMRTMLKQCGYHAQ